MKKYAFIFAAALVAFAGCNKETDPVEFQGNEKVFTADAAGLFKTVLVDGVKTYWTPGDAISVFDGQSNNEFTTDITVQSATAKFRGNAQDAAKYYALYPYTTATSMVGSEIFTSLNDTQVPLTDGLDPNAALLAAVSESNALTFKPVISYLKITTAKPVYSISVAANGGEYLAGDFKIHFDEATMSVSGGSSTGVLLSMQGQMAAGTYYVAVLPGTYNNGLTVTLGAEGDAVIQKPSSASVTLAMGTIYDMGTIDGDWSSDITSTPAALYLHGSATEGNGQQMRKEGDKFVIYNTIKAGKLNFTDGEGNNYYIAGNTLVKGTGATVMAAKDKVTRIIVDFATKSVTYDKINDKVWIQNAWDGTVTGELSYQSKGKWSGFSSTLPIAANGDERFSFRVEVNGVNTRWGSDRGNYGDFPNGTAEYYKLYETPWDQWNNLYKIYKGYKGVELTYDIEANNPDFMRFRIGVRGEHEMTLEGDGLEVYSRPFRKEAANKYVIYTKVLGGDVKYVYNGTETALTVPSDKKTAVTRITVNPSNGNVAYDVIDEWAHCKFCADYSDIGHQQYRGNGVWDGNSGGIWWRDMGGWRDERYKFNISVNGVQTCWGRHADAVTADLKYSGDESFWWMSEYDWEGHQWDYAWKLAAGLDNGATAFISINTNGDGTHVTHRITQN